MLGVSLGDYLFGCGFKSQRQTFISTGAVPSYCTCGLANSSGVQDCEDRKGGLRVIALPHLLGSATSPTVNLGDDSKHPNLL
mmetsp:Transcript_27643/g.64057  ORF Transcript_27643/g.64057 Transcript_27643/m.64057 type:complete len:82 (-) Transcript_27643:26-271(-)